MELQVTHDKIDDIPEQYRGLYTERDGKFQLTGVAGIKTADDVSRIHTALEKERGDHKETRAKLHNWDGLEPDEVRGKMDRFAELEVAAKGNKEEMDSRLEELTEARVKSRLSPVERENATLKKRLGELEEGYSAMLTERTQRTVTDEVRKAGRAEGAKVLDSAMEDVLLLAGAVFEVTEEGTVLTKENPYGITPGLAPDVWLGEMQPKRPHWWPTSTGGGSTGSGNLGGMADNPFTHDNWNLTKQGAIVKEHGTAKAEQMAKAAGTTVGGPQPTAKK